MTDKSMETALAVEFGMSRRQSLLIRSWWLVKSKPLGAIGGLILVVAILLAIFAPIVSPYDPEISDRTSRLTPPDLRHWFGTDHIARDVFSRVIYGSRVSLLVGFIAVVTSSVFGTALGVASAYFGKTLDLLLQRVVDSLQALPGLVLALTLMAAMGPSLTAVIIAITTVRIPGTIRTVRSVALSVKAVLGGGARHRRKRLAHHAPPHHAQLHGARHRGWLGCAGRRDRYGGEP